MAGKDGAARGPSSSGAAGSSGGEHAPPASSRKVLGIQAFIDARQRLQTSEARQMVSFALVCCTVGVDFTGVTMQVPLIPFYVEEFDDAKEMGFGAASALLMVSYTISQFLATPLFGMLSDRVGRRPMLLVSLLGGSIGFLAQAVLADSLWVLAILRCLTGLFGGSRPVALAWIGDAAPPDKQPKYIAGVSATVSVSLFVAPVFGGSMGLVSLRLPCFFQAGLGLVVLAAAYRYLEEPAAPEERRAQAAGGEERAARKSSLFRWKLPLVCNALVGSLAMGIIGSWQTLLPIIGARDVGLNQNEIGLIMGLAGLAIALMQFGVFIPLSRRVRLPLLGSAGMVLLSTPSLLVLTGNGIWQLLVLTFIHAAGAGLAMGGLSIVVNMLAPPHIRGTVMALTITLQAFSRVLFPLVSGPMYDAAEWAPLALIAGAGIVAAAIELALTPFVRKLSRPAGLSKEPPGEQLADASPSVDVLGRPLDSLVSGALEQEVLHSDSETQAVLEGLRSVHGELNSQLQLWRSRLQGLHDGKTPEELSMVGGPEGHPVVDDELKAELGRWLADMLVERNYRRWPQHIDTVKCTLKNAFPQMRQEPATTRVEDFIYLLESHLLLEKRWERFVLERSQAWQEYVDGDLVFFSQLGSSV